MNPWRTALWILIMIAGSIIIYLFIPEGMDYNGYDNIIQAMDDASPGMWFGFTVTVAGFVALIVDLIRQGKSWR